MAKIGTFKKAKGEYRGAIACLALSVDAVRIVPEDNPKSSAPTHRIYVGDVEVGAAWEKTSQDDRTYLSTKFDDPSFTAPFFAQLFDLHAANQVPADAGKLLIGFAFIPEDQPEVRMDQVVDWQSPYFPRIFETYDRADFAQEFLRRSPAYRRAYRSAALAPARRRTARLAGLARRWGLVFRPRP